MPEQVDQIINKMAGTEGSVVDSSKNTEKNSGQLFYCDAKSQNELNEFIDKEKPKLVALVGFAGYGKSTFIGTLYQKLLRNLQYEGYSFVDSETFVGFERRVFLRRENNENASGTKRNLLGENDILHLELKSERRKNHQVLISDKAGETYQRYLSSDSDVENDIVLENADLVVFFVDADADSAGLAKHNLIIDNYSSLLTRLVERRKLNASVEYGIVFTKVDQVKTVERKEKLATRSGDISKLFEELLGKPAVDIYNVNSTDFEDVGLNKIFARLLAPNEETEVVRDLDWVKMEIDNA